MKLTDFGDVLKRNRRFFKCYGTGILLATRVQIPAYIFKLHHGQLFGCTIRAHVEVY
jgi:hypothetical protein